MRECHGRKVPCSQRARSPNCALNHARTRRLAGLLGATATVTGRAPLADSKSDRSFTLAWALSPGSQADSDTGGRMRGTRAHVWMCARLVHGSLDLAQLPCPFKELCGPYQPPQTQRHRHSERSRPPRQVPARASHALVGWARRQTPTAASTRARHRCPALGLQRRPSQVGAVHPRRRVPAPTWRVPAPTCRRLRPHQRRRPPHQRRRPPRRRGSPVRAARSSHPPPPPPPTPLRRRCRSRRRKGLRRSGAAGGEAPTPGRPEDRRVPAQTWRVPAQTWRPPRRVAA
jgi:hypothetical protein